MKINLEKYYYIFGEGIVKGTVLLLFTYFTTYLEKEDFGRLTLYWSTIPLLALFIDFAQRSFVKKAYLDKGENIKEVIFTIILFSFFCVLMYLGIYQVFALNNYSLIDSFFDFYLIICAFLFVVVEVFLSYLQISGQALKYMIIYIGKSLIPYLGTVALFIYAQNNDIYNFPKIQAFTLAFASILTLIFVCRKISLQDTIKNFVKYSSQSLNFSLPLIIGTLSAIGLNIADRYMISFYISDEKVADYTVAYTIASILTAFFMATNKWWQRFMLTSLKNGDISLISKKFRVYFLVIILIAFSLYLAKDIMIDLLSNESYSNVNEIIPTLVIGMIFYFLYSVLLNVPFYFSKTKYVVLPALIAFVLNVILNVILIPIKGYEVAALTTCISYFFEFVVIYFICVKMFGIDIFFGKKKGIDLL